MQREYNKKWIVEESGKSGGQGDTFIARKIESIKNEEVYLLKVLKEQSNSERRERIRNEVHALRILNKVDVSEYDMYERNDDSNKYFPRIIEDNCDKYLDEDVELYYVMEYIRGKEFYNVITSEKHTLNKILESFMNLLNSVYICHKKGIIHRDIKPSNIMCRNGELSEIVLIDFGISYVEELKTDDTKLGQELENRFLHLPEKVGQSKEGKRDRRSDITYCVGILFYMLTRKNPKHLLDQNNKKPNEKLENIFYLQWVGSENLKVFNTIFDKGFQYDIDKRYQDIEELVQDINKINKYPNKEYIYDDKIKSLCLTTVLQNLKLTNKNIDEENIIIERMRCFDNRSISLGFCKLLKIGEIFYLDSKNLWTKKARLEYSIENDLDCMFIPALNLNTKIELIEDIELYATVKFTDNNKIRLYNFYVYLFGKKRELLSPLDKDKGMIINNANETVIWCEFIKNKNLFACLCENGNLKIYDFLKKSLIYEHMIDGVNGEVQKCSFSYKFEYMALTTGYTIEVYSINKGNNNEIKFQRIKLPEEVYADNRCFLDIKFCNKNNILLVMTENNIYNFNINTNEIFNRKIKKLKIFSVKYGEILAISNKDEKFILKIESMNYVLKTATLDFQKDIYLPYGVKHIDYNIKDELEVINGANYLGNEDNYSLYGYHSIKLYAEDSFNILNVGRKNIYYIDVIGKVKVYDKESKKTWIMYKNNEQAKVKSIYISEKENYIAILYEGSKLEIVKVNK